MFKEKIRFDLLEIKAIRLVLEQIKIYKDNCLN